MDIACASRSSYAWRVAIVLLTLCWCTRISTAQSTRNEVYEDERIWRFGAFFTWGAPPQYVIANSQAPISANLKLEIFSAGFEAGRILGRRHEAAPLRGQAEARIEVVPFWIGRYPSQA